MSWVAAAIIGGSTVVSGALGARASSRAASKAARSAQAGIDEQRRQFDVIQGLQQPFAVTGTGAINRLAQLLGLPFQGFQAPGGGAVGNEGSTVFSTKQVLKMLSQGIPMDEILKLGSLEGGLGPKRLQKLRSRGLSIDQVQQLQRGSAGLAADKNPIITPEGPDPSVFTESPDFRFRQQEGLAAVDRTAAARGGALSGNAIRGAEEFASNLASQEFGDFFNRLAAIAGIGQTSANASSAAAANTGNNISSLLASQGNARASGILGTANSISGALNSGLNNYLLLRGGFFGNPGGSGGFARPVA